MDPPLYRAGDFYFPVFFRNLGNNQIKSQLMNVQETWKRRTGMIFYSVLVYAAVIIAMQFLLLLMVTKLISYDRLGMPNSISWVVGLATYICYFIGLRCFGRILGAEDRKSVNIVGLSVVFSIVSFFCRLTAHATWVYLPAILSLCTIGLAMWGFTRLKKSVTFPPKARMGAHFLLIAQVIILTNSAIAFVFPLTGLPFKPLHYIVAGLSIITQILMVKGWHTIRNANPEALLEIEH